MTLLGPLYTIQILRFILSPTPLELLARNGDWQCFRSYPQATDVETIYVF